MRPFTMTHYLRQTLADFRPRALAALGATWTLLHSTLREFIWSDLRDGLIDLHTMRFPVRIILRAGLLLTLAALIVMLVGPLARQASPLNASLLPAPGRGLLVPIPLYPFSLFMLSLSWSYILTGAIQTRWFIRLPILGLFLLINGGWLTLLPPTTPPALIVAGVALLATITLALTAPRRLREHAALTFTLLLGTVGAFYVLLQTPILSMDGASELPLGKSMLENNLRTLSTLAVPLLVLIGLDMADFTVHAAEWSTQIATSLTANVSRGNLLLALFLFWLLGDLIWRGYGAIQDHLQVHTWHQTLPALAGAGGPLLLTFLCWRLLRRITPLGARLRAGELSAAAAGAAPLIVVLFYLPILTTYLILEVAQFIQTLAYQIEAFYTAATFSSTLPPALAYFNTGAAAIYQGGQGFSNLFQQHLAPWRTLTSTGLLAASFFLARRDRLAAAVFLATAGANYLWIELTRLGGPFSALNWDSLALTLFWWTLYLGLWLLYALVRKELHGARLVRGLVLALILALLHQVDFVEDPFSPFFAFAGIGFIVFGIGWDVLTIGAWANNQSTSFPRRARLFLYIGYVLLAVTLVDWAVLSHDLDLLQQFTGDAALLGFALLGRPFLFVLMVGLLSDQLAPARDIGGLNVPPLTETVPPPT